MSCNVRKYNLLKKSFIGPKNYEKVKFFLNLNLKVRFESVNLFLYVFLCLKVNLTMEQYVKLLAIFIWKFAIFWTWQLALWNLGQLAPAPFFYLQQTHGLHVWDIYIVDWPTYSVKTHLSRKYNSLLRWKRRLMSIKWKVRE